MTTVRRRTTRQASRTIASDVFEQLRADIQSIRKGDDRWAANTRRVFESWRSIVCAPRAAGSTLAGSLGTWRFTESLYAACGSPSLMRFCRILSEQFSRYRRLWARRLTRKRNIAKEHEVLCRAELRRDTAKAVAALRKHRTTTIQDLLADWNET